MPIVRTELPADIVEAIRESAECYAETRWHQLREASRAANPGRWGWYSRSLTGGQTSLLKECIAAYLCGGERFHHSWWVGGGEWGEQVRWTAWWGATIPMPNRFIDLPEEVRERAEQLRQQVLDPVEEKFWEEFREGLNETLARWRRERAEVNRRANRRRADRLDAATQTRLAMRRRPCRIPRHLLMADVWGG